MSLIEGGGPVVHHHVEEDLIGVFGVQRVLPLLGEGHGLDRLDLLLADLIGELRVVRAFILISGVREGQRSAGVGSKLALCAQICLDSSVQAVIEGTRRIVLDLRDQVQGGLAGPDVKGDGIGHVPEQDLQGAEIPVHGAGMIIRTGYLRGCRRRGIEIIPLDPLDLDLGLPGRGYDFFNGIALTLVGTAFRPVEGDRLAVFQSAVHGDGAVFIINVGISNAFIFANRSGKRDGQKILKTGNGFHFQQVDGAGRGSNVVGSAVGHGNAGDAHGVDDLLGDSVEGAVQRGGAAGVEVVINSGVGSTEIVGVGLGLRDFSDAYRTASTGFHRFVRTGVGVVDQVVQQVGLGAEGIDAEQGGVGVITGISLTGTLVGGLVGLDAPGGGGCGVIEDPEISPGTVGRKARIDGAVISVTSCAAGRGRAVGDHHDESRIAVGTLQKGRGRIQSGLPVGAVVAGFTSGESGVLVCQIDGIAIRLAVHVFIEQGDKAAGAGKVAGPVACAFPRSERPDSCRLGKGHQRHLDVAGIGTGLVTRDRLDKGINGIFRLVGAVGSVRAAAAADRIHHTRRHVVNEDDVNFRIGFDLNFGIAGDVDLDSIRAVAVISNGLVVLRRIRLARQRVGGESHRSQDDAQGQDEDEAQQELFLLTHSFIPLSKSSDELYKNAKRYNRNGYRNP